MYMYFFVYCNIGLNLLSGKSATEENWTKILLLLSTICFCGFLLLNFTTIEYELDYNQNCYFRQFEQVFHLVYIC